ncbi:MAG: aldehyde dehydrogenase family protein [Cypionkella sp.]
MMNAFCLSENFDAFIAIPLLSRPGKLSGKLQLPTVQFARGRSRAGCTRDGSVVAVKVTDNVTPRMRNYIQERFGSITRMKSWNEAAHPANDAEHSMPEAVFSRDIGRAMLVANRIESEECHINGTIASREAQMPLGGVKASRVTGGFGGKAVIAEFSDLRWITIEDPNQHYRS